MMNRARMRPRMLTTRLSFSVVFKLYCSRRLTLREDIRNGLVEAVESPKLINEKGGCVARMTW